MFWFGWCCEEIWKRIYSLMAIFDRKMFWHQRHSNNNVELLNQISKTEHTEIAVSILRHGEFFRNVIVRIMPILEKNRHIAISQDTSPPPNPVSKNSDRHKVLVWLWFVASYLNISSLVTNLLSRHWIANGWRADRTLYDPTGV